MNICVYCASSEKIDKSYIEAGEKFGLAMAQRGHTLIFGGGKYGVMGAVDRGVRKGNGNLIGVVPKFIEDMDVVDTNCTLVRTETMRERKQIMEEKSDAFVMLPGGIGTFEEFFEILTLKQLNQHSKPVVLLNTNGYFTPLIDMLENAIEQKFMSDKCRKLYFVSDSQEEIFDYIKNYKPIGYDKYDFQGVNYG